ncbi:glycine--tRNA ligase subunit beta [uncultured Parasphingopyxis sp.]|uniref:glycine--tRNA ligase subunit beta n=1 Tax=uncultured Parasphingopyxis sp. TaxID=1547918 RepID=UPI00261BF758|nr:glycine--tRNA ligase subunit beta [uncultured Parasphingopyxis sp.]
MTDFLLELLSEEIPARMQKKAREDLARLFSEQMDEAGLKAESISVWSTPRRLALIARGLPLETEAVSEERRGPRADAPDKAIEGFLRGAGLTRDQLEEREEKKGIFLYAVIDTPGRATKDVLGEAIPKIVRAFPWPKSMRWGAASQSSESLRWVRPLQGIVAILGEDLVPCEIDGVVSGFDTVGHRFHHSGPITIGSADDYAEKLRACHVIVDHEEREGIVREQGDAVAKAAGLERVHDTGLVIENAGLTEWPVPLLGGFDRAYLELPEEVIQLTARINQKYFICRTPLPLAGGAGGGSEDGEKPTPNPSRKREGDLAPNFICTANIEAKDGGAGVVAGNEKVLAARLSDAQFFWQQDRQKTLEQHAEKLGEIVFHEKLGTVADKVDRVAKLARWLVEERIVIPAKAGIQPQPPEMDSRLRGNDEVSDAEIAALADKAETAARLAKADLVTGMVGEFPDLQGIMGGYYAEAEGLDPEVAAAIRDHYKPVGQGDEVPTAPVTVAVSLADKFDSLIGFFLSGDTPTGSKDPFALRRAGLGNLGLLQQNELRFALNGISERWLFWAIHSSDAGWFNQIADTPMLQALFGRMTPRSIDPIVRAESMENFVEELENRSPETVVTLRRNDQALIDFFADRLKVQQRGAGVRHDLIDAVFALGGEDDLVRLLARVHALQDFLKTADGTNLLAGYKRAANILKKEEWESTDAAYDPEPAEALLREALATVEPEADSAIAAEDFAAAMSALAKLRAPIDAFFESVTVNDDDPAKRAARLGLLARFRDAVHRVADFSKIEG